jgi:RNA polymerase sigma-70 factor, ECF subfamily
MEIANQPVLQTLPPHGTSERTLISRILAGERKLFHELIRPHERSVYLTVFAVVRNHTDAEEAAQEAMLKAYKNLRQLSSAEKFRPWLLKIAVNEGRLKRRQAHSDLFESLEGDDQDESAFLPRDIADWRENPLELLERSDVRDKVTGALKELPKIYRQIFVLRDMEEQSVQECSRMLGITPEAVKVRLHRARLMLRERLSPIFHVQRSDHTLSGLAC